MKKPILLVVVAVLAVVSVWRWRSAEEPVAAGKRLIADRVWIDHVPRDDKDTAQVFVMLTEHAAGVFNASSQWRGAYELFRYEAHGGELRLVYPQTGERETVRAKAKRCNERDMDFCLELEGASRGVKRYYSREGWEIEGTLDAIKPRIDGVRAELIGAAR